MLRAAIPITRTATAYKAPVRVTSKSSASRTCSGIQFVSLSVCQCVSLSVISYQLAVLGDRILQVLTEN